jgi:hypothetical protein
MRFLDLKFLIEFAAELEKLQIHRIWPQLSSGTGVSCPQKAQFNARLQ